jgi:hypothetical protein
MRMAGKGIEVGEICHPRLLDPRAAKTRLPNDLLSPFFGTSVDLMPLAKEVVQHIRCMSAKPLSSIRNPCDPSSQGRAGVYSSATYRALGPFILNAILKRTRLPGNMSAKCVSGNAFLFA